MCMKKNTKRVLRIILIIAAVLVLALLTMKFFIPIASLLGTEDGRMEILHKVESYGIFAPLVFAALMALQIVIAFIPGGPLELIAGMLFGGIKGTIFTMLGAVAGTLAVYGLVRIFGKPLVHLFVSEEKMQQFSILHDEKRLEFWVFVLFLIPGIPKDLLTYIVPLTSMRPLRFVLLANLARFPAIAASVFMGDSLTEGRYWLCLVIAGVAAVLAVIGYRLKNSILKNKGETT